MKKYKQLTLEYFRYNPLNIDILILLVIYISKNITRTKLTKLISNILVEFDKSRAQERVVQYRHGFISVEVDKAILELMRLGLVERNDRGELVLTHKGLNTLRRILPIVKEFKIYKELEERIRDLYLLPTHDLTIRIYKISDFLNPIVKNISGYKITYIFDWSDFGDGLTIKPYHISMLLAFAYSEDYFEQVKKNIPSCCKVSIDCIRDKIYFSDLLKNMHKRRPISCAMTLTEVFVKKEPSYISENKEEGKNYIANLWMIVEAINIFHVLLGIAPSAVEIATLCLKDVLFGEERRVNDEKRDYNKMREKLIQNDLKKLVKYGIIKAIKYGKGKKNVRYALTAKCYVDDNVGKEFRVLEKNIVEDYYKSKIKPLMSDNG